MFSVNGYNGSQMPDKTLCLTYDDGPGPLTLDIAEYLHSFKIRATFFVVGKYAYHHREILSKLKSLGHIVANHTYEHPDLPYYCSIDGNVQDQIIRTNTLIKEFTDGKTVFFRAPFGKWSPEVTNELNKNILSSVNHVGPIYWDIPGIDCYYWKLDKSVKETLDKYLADIEEQGKGIVVMHDDLADMDSIKHKNRTLELTRQLIPVLIEKGYRFIGLDEIDSIKKVINQPDLFAIKGRNGNFLQYTNDKELLLLMNGVNIKDLEGLWQIEFLDFGKVALKASNGYYMHANPLEDENVYLKFDQVGAFEQFDLIPVRDDAFALRTNNGNYLASGSSKTARLMANAPHMLQADIFKFYPVNIEKKKKLSFKKRMELLKKQLLFVKSKILQAK